MAYLLDANVFIDAKNRYYGLDFAPGFWEWIDREHASGRVFSIEQVRDELVGGDDELADWARSRGPEFFLPPDQHMLPSLTAVAQWARSGRHERPHDLAAVIAQFALGDASTHGRNVARVLQHWTIRPYSTAPLLSARMAEQTHTAGHILAVIEACDWDRLCEQLHPSVHWTTAIEEHVRGPAAVLAMLQGDPPPAPPAYHELRDGLLVRWIDTPG